MLRKFLDLNRKLPAAFYSLLPARLRLDGNGVFLRDDAAESFVFVLRRSSLPSQTLA